jgi:hypothetical protein
MFDPRGRLQRQIDDAIVHHDLAASNRYISACYVPQPRSTMISNLACHTLLAQQQSLIVEAFQMTPVLNNVMNVLTLIVKSFQYCHRVGCSRIGVY